MAATATRDQIELLANRYGEAWNACDVRGILALHAPDSVFHVHGAGDAAIGAEAVRGALEAFYSVWREPHFAERRLLLAEDHWVLEWSLSARAAGMISGDGVSVEAHRVRVSFEGVDVITVRDGLVAAKDVYIDALAVQRQLEEAADA